jgi:hypothetical protein
MSVETLGEAWGLSWKIHIRCLYDGREGMKHKRECGFRHELDMMSLVCTRGRDFPIARIAERLRCPRCGCREISVMFSPSTRPNAEASRLHRDNLYRSR